MKKTHKTTVFDSQKQAASALNIPLNRIRAAKRAGCDAFRNGRVNASRLLAWLDAHKGTTSSSSPSPAVSLATGAAGNLMRLETSETQAWSELQRAIADGDPFNISTARRAFLETSEALRRLDRDVADSRRIGVESVPRATIENLLSEILNWWATSLRQTLVGPLAVDISKAEGYQAVADLLEPIAHRGLFDAVANVKSWSKSPPKWLLDCAEANLRHYFNRNHRNENLEARATILAALESMTPQHFQECLEFIKARAGSATTDKP